VQLLPARDQRADSCGVTEDLVERDRHEIRLEMRQIEARGGDEGGGVEQHVPAFRLRPPDPIEGMLHRREIGLRGVGEQVVPTRAGRLPSLLQLRFGHTHVWQRDRDVGHLCAPGVREFADAVDRIVVIESQQVAVFLPERI
jgi:hypothetical protein